MHNGNYVKTVLRPDLRGGGTSTPSLIANNSGCLESRQPGVTPTILLLPVSIMLGAMNLTTRVIEFAVEPRILTRRNDAIGLGRGFIPLNLRFVSFNPCGFAAGQRSVFQSIGDAVLLILLAAIDVGRVIAGAMDLATRVIEFAIEPRALTRRDDAIGLGPGFIPLNLRFFSFNPSGFAARYRAVFQTIGDAFLLTLLASIYAWSVCLIVLRQCHRAKPGGCNQGECKHMKLSHNLLFLPRTDAHK